MELITLAKQAKEASKQLALTSNEQRNIALSEIANQLEIHKKDILEANQIDICNAKNNNKSDAFIDRLTLNMERISHIIEAVIKLTTLADPLHQVLHTWQRGELQFEKKSVPIGVIAIIYEARPNVTIDAACLCLKSGNACFLRGSSDTIETNKVLVACMKTALIACGLNLNTIQLLEDCAREKAIELMQMNAYIDLLIPRGSASLIAHCIQHASVPIIETGSGNCHVYVDKDADFKKAIAIIINAKTQRVSVCNACESILIHQDILQDFLPLLVRALQDHNVVIHACQQCVDIENKLLLAKESDYACEYLSLEVSIKSVASLQSAIQHINTYNSAHSDAIVSENKQACETFANEIDSACVYINTSTRFSDGEEFGFEAEIGISTQKIHVRGPMGLFALVSYKYIITSQGAIRK